MATRPPVLPPDEDLQPAPDWEGVARTIGNIINPLARQQADVQKHAIDADVQKYRLATDANERYARRRLYVALILSLVIAGGIAAFVIAGQPQLAERVLTFIAGALMGAGSVKVVQRVR